MIRRIHAARAATAVGLALAAHGVGWAAETTVVERPFQVREVEEYRLSDQGLIQYKNEFEASSVQIDLGYPGSGRVAQAYSTYNNTSQSTTYWVSVDDYPGISLSPSGTHFDNGLSAARVSQIWQMRKDSNDASLTMRITGGRLRLQDYVHSGAAEVAEVGLVWSVHTSSVNVSGGDYNALLAGHGGTLGGSETFDYVVRGFQLDPDSYTEKAAGAGSLNVVEAVLDIPAQDIPIDISAIIPFNEFTSSGGEFTLVISMWGEALAVDPERGAAQAFLRDPLSMGQADPLRGGNGLTFTGVSVLAPVPEPESSVLFLIGCGLLGRVAWRRTARAS